MHSPIRMFYVGFLSLWIAWCHMKHQFVLQLSPELQHILSSLQLSGVPARLSVMQLYLGAAESGTA